MKNKDARSLMTAINEGVNPRKNLSKFETQYLKDLKGVIDAGKDLSGNQGRVLQQIYQNVWR